MKRFKYISRLFLLFLIVGVPLTLLSSGCFSAGGKVQFRYNPEKIVGKIEDLRRIGKIYRDLDTIFIGDIMWRSADFEMAYINEMKETDRIDSDQYATLVKELEEKDSREIVFLAALYTAEEKWNDFDKENSIWNLRLAGRGGELVSPKKIEKIDKEDLPDSHLYSFISHWKTVYRITYPRNEAVAGEAVYSLKVYSILGDTSFSWVTYEKERAKPAKQ